MTVEVTFHGACGLVTGSCFEVRTARAGILIDCGMFQGTKTVKQLNYEPFPFDPRSITAVVLTHAHIDHCGLLPKLRVAGFKGAIIATPETADLLTYVLPDSGYVQEHEVERLNRRNRQRGGRGVEPIYTRADGVACAHHVTPRPMGRWLEAAPGIRARFWDAAHILGSASVELEVDVDGSGSPLTLLFSGDIGPGAKAIQGTPQAPSGVDYLFAESTYGDRVRPDRTPDARRAALQKEIATGLKAGGLVLIPAFAVERTQELLVDLDWLFEHGELPAVPVFVDSPLATQATQVFAKHLAATVGTRPFTRANLHFVGDAQSSRKLARLRGGAIIVAGSGMCDAGRIRHHLKNNLSQSTATVLLVGYQAPGTLGRLLSGGVKRVRIEGEEVAVNARVRELTGYSGHADQDGLTQWIKDRLPVKHQIFLVHGEDEARRGLAARLAAAGLDPAAVRQPQLGETVALTDSGARTERVRARVDLAVSGAFDWHNAYAQTLLDLRERLEKLPDDRARKALLGKVAGALQPR
jgi:metallo-beta-lactamase family protein